MSFYVGYYPDSLAIGPAELVRDFVIRKQPSGIVTSSGGLLPGSGHHDNEPQVPTLRQLLPPAVIVASFEALVSALSVVPVAYVRVKLDGSGLAFDKGTPNASVGTLVTTDPRRITYSVVDQSAKLAMFTALKAALVGLTVPKGYKVSFKSNGALLVFTHPDDVEV